MGGWRPGDETAAELGRLLAVLASLHAILGTQSMRATSSDLVCLLDELSLSMADHAERLVDHLPRRAGVVPESLTVLGELDGPIGALADTDDPLDLLALTRGVVFPRLLEAVIDLEVGCSPAAERALAASLGVVVRGLEDVLAPVDALLEHHGSAQQGMGEGGVAAAFAAAVGPVGLWQGPLAVRRA